MTRCTDSPRHAKVNNDQFQSEIRSKRNSGSTNHVAEAEDDEEEEADIDVQRHCTIDVLLGRQLLCTTSDYQLRVVHQILRTHSNVPTLQLSNSPSISLQNWRPLGLRPLGTGAWLTPKTPSSYVTASDLVVLRQRV